MGGNVVQLCNQFMINGFFPYELNEILITLIPKKKHVESMTDLRPIALCNVVYKILAKLLANQLKHLLPAIISDC